MKRKLYIVSLIVLLLTTVSCEKILDIKPEGVILSDEAVETLDDLQNLLNSCYDVGANTYSGQLQQVGDVLGDDLARPNNNDDLTEVYTRNVNFFNGTVGSRYADIYRSVFRVNSIFENIDKVSASESEKTRVLAEASFIRGLSLFEAQRYFSQPPGYTSDNSHLGVVVRTETTSQPKQRSLANEVYNQIIADLEFAIANLPEENGVYADKYAAHALLAKVYFFMNDFTNAVTQADAVINSGNYSLDTLSRFDTLGSLSNEVIFYWASSNTDNRSGGFTGAYRSDNNPSPTLTASKEVYDIFIGLSGDRRADWVGIVDEGLPAERYPISKFNSTVFAIPYLHLTDIKLLRAESLGELNIRLTEARDDLNEIRTKNYGAGTNPFTSTLQTRIIEVAREERRIEMLGEGDRVFQLKRIGALGLNSALPIPGLEIRSAPWNCNGMILQFPASEKTAEFVLNPEGGC